VNPNYALSDVGLTALSGRIPADAGISCHVIAGLARGHLLVDRARGSRAPALPCRA